MNNLGLWLTWTTLGRKLRAIDAMNYLRMWMTWMTLCRELKALDARWYEQLMILWPQAFGCFEWLRPLEDMNDSWSWALGSKRYEHLKSMDDRNNSWSWAQDSKWYEQLRSIVYMNYSGSWAKGSSVRIEPLKAWHYLINLEFIISLMMFQLHSYPSLFHVLYSMSIWLLLKKCYFIACN